MGTYSARGPLADFGTAIIEAGLRGETVVVADVGTDSRFTDGERQYLLAAGTAAFIGVPRTRDGRAVAALTVHSATPRPWTREHILLVELSAECL